MQYQEYLGAKSYYPFGMAFSHNAVTTDEGNLFWVDEEGGVKNRYSYNGKEYIDNLDINLHDYGARYYDPAIARFTTVDPMAASVKTQSPFSYSFNNPIVFTDTDGELPIFINGRVTSPTLRGNPDYWTAQIINTIKYSSIDNPGGQTHFVDGDQTGSRNIIGAEHKSRGAWGTGSLPGGRKIAGEIQAKQDFDNILSKLERDPNTGQIIEKIQIYTHSRGAAFGEGYAKVLQQLISENSDQFADPTNVIDFMLHLAPHQSGYVNSVDGISSFSMHHDNDKLSGNDMGGSNVAFSSDIGKGTLSAHSVSGFNQELGSFLNAFAKNGVNHQGTINDFVSAMKAHGIKVTVQE